MEKQGNCLVITIDGHGHGNIVDDLVYSDEVSTTII